ncbi:MAG: efflux RND transporter periplasmic adaptor subunit [Rhodospirillales bacterium]
MQPVTESRSPSTEPVPEKPPRAAAVLPQHPRAKWRGQIGLWVLVAGSIAAAAAFLINRGRTAPAQSAPAAVRTVAVRSGALERTLRLVGSTAAERSMELRAPSLGGRRGRGDFRMLIQFLAPSGSRVSQGDLVASFDPMYQQIYLDNERAQRINSEAVLEQNRAAYELRMHAHRQEIRAAQAEMEKAAHDLKTMPVRSAIEAAKLQLAYEEAKAAYERLLREVPFVETSAGADVERARLDVEESLVEERRAQANLDRMNVRAPIKGIAIVSEVFHAGERKQIRVGDQIGRGQPFMQIVDLDSIVVQASVNQVDAETLRLNAPARVYFDAFPDLVLPARLDSIGPLAKSTGFRGDYVAHVPVRLTLEGQDPRVIPNLSVGAEVILATEQSEGIVPREAVFYDPKDQQPYAFVKTPGGWEKRELELGLSNHVAVAVRSGLSEGDIVAAEMPSGTF